MKQMFRDGSLNVTKAIIIAHGAEIPYRGTMAKLHFIKEKVRGVSIEYNDGFFITVPESIKDPTTQVRWQLNTWLMGKLQADCDVFIARYKKKLGVDVKFLYIREKSSVWSDSVSDHSLNISWSLIYAPVAVLEYVVASEICVMKHGRNSKKSKELLDSLLPEWEQSQTWLKKNKKIRKVEL